ncbi:MAG: hypothetical protein AB7L66_07260 [Gemmatimonadales bacterium]
MKTSWCLALAAGGLGCAAPAAETPGREADAAALRPAAEALYRAYGQAVATGPGEAVAAFYHPGGAVRVLNGTAQRLSRAALDSSYRSGWSAPGYFSWTDLTFDPFGPDQVLVSGGFRWLPVGGRDTTAWIYAALLERTDSGLAIRFEHETLKPTP